MFSVISYNIDSRLVALDKRPILVLPTAVAKDGGTTIYRGLGYKVIGWKRLELKKIDDKEIQGTMRGYEISTIFNSQNISKGPQKKLIFVPNKYEL